MRAALALLLLAGCQRPDPALVAVRDAIAAWEQGVEALEAGDPATARTRFQEARRLRPDDPLLWAWEAQAMADAGDLEGAVALVDAVLAVAPGLGEARYNRAAWLARLGAPEEEVAAELRRALEDGARPEREVLQDPDFKPLLGHPAFSFLPAQALTIGVEAPVATVFWGSELMVRFRIAGAGDDPLALTAEETSGPVTLLSVIDDSNPSTDGTFRDITYTFRVVGEGTVRFGPFHAWAGDRRATVGAITVPTAAPEGKKEGEADPPPDFRTPREIVGRAEIPSARVVDGELIVAHLPGDRMVLDPVPAAPPVHYEQRERSSTVWEAWRYPGVAPGAVRVKVLRAGHAVYDAPAATASTKPERG